MSRMILLLHAQRPRKSRSRSPYRLRLERLEDRLLRATFNVDSTADADDFDPGDGVCSTSPSGGACTLRAAISETEALANVGDPDNIFFSIPSSDPGRNQATGVFTIQPESALPVINDSVTINGYTQDGSNPNTLDIGSDATLLIELDGTNAGTGVDGLVFGSALSTLRGLIVNRFDGNGIVLGGGIGAGLLSHNLIEGNFIGTDPTGSAGAGNALNGILVLDDANTIGGTTAAARNVISANGHNGILISGTAAVDNVVQGNRIGTVADGTSVLGNGRTGVSVFTPPDTVGGSVAGAGNSILGNVISGNTTGGVLLDNGTHLVQDNFIGTDVTSTLNLRNLGEGVLIRDASDSRIERNVIAFNLSSTGDTGVAVVSGTGIAILTNRIFSNAGLGIDLGNDGPTDNDLGDEDTGANNKQNFPDLDIVATGGEGQTTVVGSLSSEPDQTYTIEFFANTTCDESGFGEGERFLASIEVTTDPDTGIAFFRAVLNADTSLGEFVTATATSAIDGTSEFSLCQIVEPQVDLSIEKLDSSDPVIAGHTLTYTITVTNSDTIFDAKTVVVSDTLPPEVEFISAIPDQGECSQNYGTVTCGLGTIPGNGSVSIEIAARVPSSIVTATTLSNTASVTTATFEENTDNNSAVEQTTVVRLVDLVVSKTESTDPVIAGSGIGNLTYIVTLMNAGPSDASGVRLTESLTLPAGVSVESITPSGQTSFVDSVWLVGTLSAGSSETLTVILTVAASAQTATDVISNTASNVIANEPLTNTGDDSVTLRTSILRETDLSILKTDSADPVDAGSPFSYTVTVLNAGPSNASGVVVTDTLPTGLTFDPGGSSTFCSADGPLVICNIGNIAFDASIELSIGVLSSPALADGTMLTNTAMVSGSEADPEDGNNSDGETTTFRRQVSSADLSIIKTDSLDPVVAGTSFSYTVRVTNAGPSNATEVAVTDTLPAGLTFLANGSSTSCSATGQTVTCTVGNVQVDASVDLTIMVAAASSIANGATLTDTVTVSGAEGDPDSNNNSDLETTTFNREANLSITKTSLSDPAIAGTSLTYRLEILNSGPSDSSGSTVTDTLPAGVTLQTAQSDHGACGAEGDVVTCNLNAIPAGTSVFVTVTVLVQPSLANGSFLTNTATVSGADVDPNSQNNSTSIDTEVIRQTDLIVTKTDTPDPVTVGSELAYRLVVSNTGPSHASGVVLSDSLPAQVQFVSVSPPSANCSVATGTSTVTCAIGVLSSGQSVTVDIVVRPTVAGLVSNTATVSGNETESNSENNSSTAQTTVDTVAAFDIAVTFFTSGGAGALGQLAITYVITGSVPPAFELGFFGSADARFQVGDTEQLPRFTVSAAADRTVGTHTLLIDGTPYAGLIADLNSTFVVVMADPSNVLVETDETNNDISFIGVFHRPVSGMPLVVRGRDDTDRYTTDNPNDIVTLRPVVSTSGTELEGTGTFGTFRVPNGEVSDIRVLSLGGNDAISGNCQVSQPMTVRGGTGDDVLTGGIAADVLDGEAGNDTLAGCGGNDMLQGGLGTDQASFAASPNAVFVSLPLGTATDRLGGTGNGTDQLAAIENVLGSQFADDIFGDALANVLLGSGGNDTVRGGLGSDEIDGGTGNDFLCGDTDVGSVGDPDTMRGGDGNDSIVGHGGADFMDGGAGNDFLCGLAGNDTAIGGLGNDTILGDTGNDELRGGDGNDLISGGLGDDRIFGEAGDDALTGDAGSDSIDGGLGFDAIFANRKRDVIVLGGRSRQGGRVFPSA
jgi:uncharacterized repeat protein (TIGR01451 family)/CSLREA domain-containing protein